MVQKKQRPGAVDDKTRTLISEAAVALQKFDTEFETPGGANIMAVGDPIDPQANDTWDAAQLMANATNLKRVVDEWAAVSQNKAVQGAGLQDQLNSLFLRWADDAHVVTQRLATDGASLSQLQSTNAALASQRATNSAQTWDNFNFAGETDTTAQGAMANNLANQMRSVVFEALQAAVTSIAQTSAPAQGTTGVAQGALQMQVPVEMAQILVNNNTIQTAILAELAKIETALGVLLTREVVPPTS